jgi:hypothetical protein
VGKALGKGILTVDTLKLLKTPIVNLPKVTEPFRVGQRVLVGVTSVTIYPQRSGRGSYYGRYETVNGKELTLVVSEVVPRLNKVSMLQGYLLDSGSFYVERFW